MIPPRYFLCRETFLCPTDFHWMLLDLERDLYLAVHRRHFDPLGPWLHGWSEALGIAGNSAAYMSSETLALATELVTRGLLTTRAQSGKAVEAAAVPVPTDTLDPRRRHKGRAASTLYMPVFMLAAARADYLLRRRSLSEITRSVANRKKRRSRSAVPFDRAAAERLFLIFNALRPLYPRDYLCLFDSLALLEFFAIFDLFPSWVFGVTTDPFQAHCWIQQGRLLVNDVLERASTYTPILCV